MVTFDSVEDEPVVISATDGYTFAQLSTWRPVSIPDPDGYCVKDGKLHILIPVPRSAPHHQKGGQISSTIYLQASEVLRKEQEYGL
jgi:hypothetical protein